MEFKDDLARAQAIVEAIAMPGWQHVLKPIFEERRHAMVVAMRDPSLARKYKVPDDYIRGQLDILDLLLDHPAELIESVRNAAVEDKLADERESEYDAIARDGFGKLMYE